MPFLSHIFINKHRLEASYGDHVSVMIDCKLKPGVTPEEALPIFDKNGFDWANDEDDSLMVCVHLVIRQMVVDDVLSKFLSSPDRDLLEKGMKRFSHGNLGDSY